MFTFEASLTLYNHLHIREHLCFLPAFNHDVLSCFHPIHKLVVAKCSSNRKSASCFCFYFERSDSATFIYVILGRYFVLEM
jgi:hypothetical protein